jgi:hypothetical protein
MADAVAASQPEIEMRPYSPSWVDRFTDWVDRLPGPAWLFYVVLGLVLYLIEVAIQWSTGAWGEFHSFQLIFISFIPYQVALIHYLDRQADAALNQFRPSLTASDTDYADLRYRLKTMPALPALLAGLIGIVVGVVTFSAIPVSLLVQVTYITPERLSILFNQIIILAVNFILFVFLYHTWRQLRLASIIYERYTQVDLFTLGPLYAFSTLSAYTALGMLPIAYSLVFIVSELFSLLPINWFTVVFTLVAVFTFIRPLTGIHGLLAQEKERLLDEIGQRLKASIAELHRRIDSGDMTDMDNLNKTLASLELEHAAVKRISTWPWQPETPRWLVAALLFPLLLWLLQRLIQRVLGS